ncbi:helix-turn-helix domain-containing protein [Streptomyces sp. IB2014 016-6]|uniref:winged helix-turn-helix transcriptional regulator n=1 Tax=Streptomyces sp. IB2014 016-6 TaxID=2517818 RepID=UPI0011C8481C|nr:helix-turn-helix domain-containing protein [Streptomyces sp. IB2014 016-6]TXL90403.1 transcriptional regulator [Streptomyces sp. IB2014 016-6]
MEEGTSKSPRHPAGTASAATALGAAVSAAAVSATSRCDYGDADPFQWDTREDCEVRQILDRIGDKWSLLVIALLDVSTMRFTELRREIDGISQRMLTVTLRQLERDGLVKRTVHPVVPPRVEYRLTPMGRTLHTTINALVVWTEEHQNQIAAAREDYDRRAAEAEAGAAQAL